MRRGSDREDQRKASLIICLFLILERMQIDKILKFYINTCMLNRILNQYIAYLLN